MAITGYNPSDPTQAAFLRTISQAETGNTTNPNLGVGGANLSGAPTDAYGFPQWGGVGNSHGAGLYQFEPGTWDTIASAHNLNFQNPSDQSAGAWYLAQQVYQQKTGGDLTTALRQGDYQSVQAALNGTWATGGNAAQPQGFAASYPAMAAEGDGGSTIYQTPWGDAVMAPSTGAANSALTGGAAAPGSSNVSGATSTVGSLLGDIENWFERFGLILVGGLLILIAGWAMLSNAGVVPSPKSVARAALA